MRWSEEEYNKWLARQATDENASPAKPTGAQRSATDPNKGNTPDQSYRRFWREWERSVNEQCRLLQTDGSGIYGAYIVQAGPPSERVKTGKGVYTVETDKGPPDFVGFWEYGPIAFDAKVTTKQTFSFTKPSAHNKGNWHQFEYLRAMHVTCANLMPQKPVAGVFIYFINEHCSRWAPIGRFSINGRIRFDETIQADTLQDVLRIYAALP